MGPMGAGLSQLPGGLPHKYALCFHHRSASTGKPNTHSTQTPLGAITPHNRRVYTAASGSPARFTREAGAGTRRRTRQRLGAVNAEQFQTQGAPQKLNNW